MAVTANSLITPQSIKSPAVVCTAAKTTYNDLTNAVLLYSAGSNGSLLRRLTATPRATVTATKLQLFKYDGSTVYFVDSALMAAQTMAQTTQTVPVDFGYNDINTIWLQNGWGFYVGIGVALAGGIVFAGEVADL